MPAVDLTRASEEALDVVRRWGAAFPTADVDGLVGLFAEDATFLGTQSRSLVTEASGIREYFQRALSRDRPRTARLVDYSVETLSDDLVLVTGLDAITGVKDGKPYTLNGRVTFLVARRGEGWRIVHLHRSHPWE